jgi:hypothetical protein
MKSELLKQHNTYAWFVGWPLILFAMLSSCTQSCSQGSTASDSAQRDAVQGFGQKAVAAYVSASAVDTAAVDAIYGPLVGAPSDDTGFPFPAETVLAVTAGAACGNGRGSDGQPVQTPKLVATKTDKSQVWSVNTEVLTGRGDQCWQQQVVVTASGLYRVEGLPGQIPPAPTALPPSDDEQGHGLAKVEAGSPIYLTVAEFFDAWLTGQGYLSLVASDDVRAFSEPPYGSISIDSVNASRQPDKPEKSITVAASVLGRKIATEKLTYNLTLTAAAGRWVVTDVAAAPDAN